MIPFNPITTYNLITIPDPERAKKLKKPITLLPFINFYSINMFCFRELTVNIRRKEVLTKWKPQTF